MDLLFWINIHQTSASSKTIAKRIKLCDLQKIYVDKTLFHHYGSELDVIKEFHRMYIENHKINGPHLMPLTLLYPDKDGLTSIDWALRKKRPRIFEYMLDLVSLVQSNFPASRMLLYAFPNMIKEESHVIYHFFDESIFQPVSL